jgi:hypothetical protein
MAAIDSAQDPSEQAETVDRIREVINSLVRERQTLRLASSDRTTLEANRISIVYWQQELSKRLGLRVESNG